MNAGRNPNNIGTTTTTTTTTTTEEDVLRQNLNRVQRTTQNDNFVNRELSNNNGSNNPPTSTTSTTSTTTTQTISDPQPSDPIMPDTPPIYGPRNPLPEGSLIPTNQDQFYNLGHRPNLQQQPEPHPEPEVNEMPNPGDGHLQDIIDRSLHRQRYHLGAANDYNEMVNQMIQIRIQTRNMIGTITVWAWNHPFTTATFVSAIVAGGYFLFRGRAAMILARTFTNPDLQGIGGFLTAATQGRNSNSDENVVARRNTRNFFIGLAQTGGILFALKVVITTFRRF